MSRIATSVRRRRAGLLLLASLAPIAACEVESRQAAAVAWPLADPETRAATRAALDTMRAALQARRTRALLVARHGAIIYEWYAPRSGPTTRHPVASLAKPLVAGMALAVLLDDGRIALDDPAARYVPGWAAHPQRSRITIRHLATHTSGPPHGRSPDGQVESSPWAQAFWAQAPDAVSAVISGAPVLFEPGSGYAYSGPAFGVLGYALTRALQGTPTPTLHDLLRERIMEPLGIPESAWSISYGAPFHADGMTVHAAWGGAAYTARAVARIGQLMLQRGEWNGRRLFAAARVDQLVHDAAARALPAWAGQPHPVPAVTWWSNANGAWPSLPRDAYAGAGANHALLLVVPSLDLVAVRLGGALEDVPFDHPAYWRVAETWFFGPFARALEPRAAPGRLNRSGTGPRRCSTSRSTACR